MVARRPGAGMAFGLLLSTQLIQAPGSITKQ